MTRSAMWLLVGAGVGFAVALLILPKTRTSPEPTVPAVHPTDGAVPQPPTLATAPDAPSLRAQLDAATQRIHDLEAKVSALQATSVSPEYAVPRWQSEMIQKLTQDGDSGRDLAQLANAIALSDSALADILVELNEVESDRLLRLNWDQRTLALEKELGDQLPSHVLSKLREEFLTQWRQYRRDIRTTWLERVRSAATTEDRARLERLRGEGGADVVGRLVFFAKKVLASEGLESKWETLSRYL